MTPIIKIHLLRTYFQHEHRTMPLVEPRAVEHWINTHDVRNDQIIELPLDEATFSQLNHDELLELQKLVNHLLFEKVLSFEQTETFIDFRLRVFTSGEAEPTIYIGGVTMLGDPVDFTDEMVQENAVDHFFAAHPDMLGAFTFELIDWNTAE